MSQIETKQSGSFIYNCLTLYFCFHLFLNGLIIDSLSKTFKSQAINQSIKA